jgi:crotonobetainyl-CoA:carnitine CoA-transferase CaiB-like acyl-CoA transferase
MAMTGVLDQIRADGTPAIPGLQIGDLLGGALAAFGMLLAALLAAQRTGEGRVVDVAMSDGLLAHHFFPHAELDTGRTPQAERTLLTGGVACYRVYRTADGRHLALGALEHKFWKAFCDAAGLPHLVDRHWAFDEAPGSAAAAETIAEVARHIGQRTLAEWESALAAADCCATPVLTPAEALAHPHHRARGLVHRQGDVTEVGPLAPVSGHRWSPVAAPRLGEHTRALLADLGYDAARIDQLERAAIVRST